MTAPWHRRRRGLLTAAWCGSALTAAFALIGLLVDLRGARLRPAGPASRRLQPDDRHRLDGLRHHRELDERAC